MKRFDSWRRTQVSIGALLLSLPIVSVHGQDAPGPAQQSEQSQQTEEVPRAEPAEREPPQAQEPRTEASDDIFIPSEEIPADEEVTFPVDI